MLLRYLNLLLSFVSQEILHHEKNGIELGGEEKEWCTNSQAVHNLLTKWSRNQQGRLATATNVYRINCLFLKFMEKQKHCSLKN